MGRLRLGGRRYETRHPLSSSLHSLAQLLACSLGAVIRGRGASGQQVSFMDTAIQGLITLEKSGAPRLPMFHVGDSEAQMNKEELRWPEIGRGRYAVDVNGIVYSTASGSLQPLKPGLRAGYPLVFLCFGKKDKRRVPVHRIVALAFLPLDKVRTHVNHKNGVKTDNRPGNLEWVTPKENSLHAIATGLYAPPRKFTDAQVRIATQMRSTGAKLREVADAIGCSVTTAHEISKSRSA